MGSESDPTIPAGFTRTSWRGMEIAHPSDWEPGFLSPAGKPGRCVFVDRRFQRLEVQWKRAAREPNLRQMYQRVGKSYRDHPSSALTGARGWEGMVRREEKSSIVYAGRHFKSERWLVQVVLIWPGRRDRQVERAVLASIAPQAKGDAARWQALGLSAVVPSAYELASHSSEVGRVRWDFERPGARKAGLTIERIALGQFWLTESLADWLKGEVPSGFRAGRQRAVDLGGHPAAAVHSRRAALRRGTRRVDLAWTCPGQDRVYRVGVWQRTVRDIDWPRPLAVHCCRPVLIGPCTE